MPKLWSYLLKSYFQVFFLCVLGFIGVLLVTRFQEIARLAAINSQFGKIALFTFFQIPYILPIAIPISGLISAILLMNHLSNTHELTAFRTSGISIKTVSAPLMIAAFLLSVLNFIIVSDITPRCRHLSHSLIESASTINPLFLMKNSKMLKLEDSYVDMKIAAFGKEAHDVVFAVKNRSNHRLSLMTAKTLTVKNQLLEGDQVAIISNLGGEDKANYDHLLIENQSSMVTSKKALTSLMQRTTHRIGMEHLPMKALLQTFSDPEAKPKTVKKAHFELYRRLFFPSITFAFTLVGFSLGMQIGRGRKKKGIYLAILLSALTFICSIAAKSFQLTPYIVLLFYSLPFPILILISLWYQRRILAGVE